MGKDETVLHSDERFARVAKLVRAARRGDETAFRTLLELHDRVVTATLVACGVRCPETARDLAQDVALKAWRNLDRLEDPRSFPAWIRRIAANAARDSLRRLTARREDALESALELAADDDPEQRSGRRSELRAMLAVLEAEDEETVALVIARADGASVADLARQHGISTGALKMRLLRIRQRLRRRLEERA